MIVKQPRDTIDLYKARLLDEQTHNIDFQVEYGALFDGSTGYLNQLFNTGDFTQFSIKIMAKRCSSGVIQHLTSTASSSGWFDKISFESDDSLVVEFRNSSSTGRQAYLVTSNLFRDYSSWIDILVVWDSPNVTESERLRLYINGIRVTDFSTETYPLVDAVTYGMNHPEEHYIGARSTGANVFDGYMSECHFIDGQALTADDFGVFDMLEWKPKKYTGTYGTNGFYLNFSDASNLGLDTSGNANNWTENGTMEQVQDTPTHNLPVLNPLDYDGNPTTSDGNRQISITTSSSIEGLECTLLVDANDSVGYYYEVEIITNTGNGPWFGLVHVDERSTSLRAGDGPIDAGCSYRSSGDILPRQNGVDGVFVNSSPAANGDIANIAFKDGKIWFGLNGEWLTVTGDAPNPELGTGASYSNLVGNYLLSNINTGTSTVVSKMRFGKNDWSYTAPNGFKEITSSNASKKAIDPDLSQHFETLLWTGNGTSQTITGTDWKEKDGSDSAQLVWIKNRDTTSTPHMLYDTTRGAFMDINSDDTSVDTYSAAGLSLFNSDGFDIGSNANINLNTDKIVGWRFRAGHKTDMVEFLAHFNGNDASTNYVSEDWQQQVATFGADAQLDSAQSKFGTSSLYLDGTGDYITFPSSLAYDIGQKDFTMECWIRYEVVGSSAMISKWHTTGNQRTFQLDYDGSGNMRLRISTNGTDEVTAASESWTPVADTWYHVAAERVNGSIYLYVDGTMLGSGTANTSDFYTSTSKIQVGGQGEGSSVLQGWIDEPRIIVGEGVYGGSSFTPETTAYENPKFNTEGTLNSKVSVNNDLGFSIVKAIGNVTAGETVGHGLSEAPTMIIAKELGFTSNWVVYHKALGAENWMRLNDTTESQAKLSNWNDTEPTKTVITLGTVNNTNSTTGMIYYCFTDSQFIDVGSYSGNNSSDGPVIHTNGEPNWFMVKRSITAGGNWGIMDNVRETTNPNDEVLRADLPNVTLTGSANDLNSNVLKVRNVNGIWNTSGTNNYVYISVNKPKLL